MFLYLNCFLRARKNFMILKNVFIWYDTCQMNNTSLSGYPSFQKIHLNFRWENHKNITEHNSRDISFKRILQLPLTKWKFNTIFLVKNSFHVQVNLRWQILYFNIHLINYDFFSNIIIRGCKKPSFVILLYCLACENKRRSLIFTIRKKIFWSFLTSCNEISMIRQHTEQ